MNLRVLPSSHLVNKEKRVEEMVREVERVRGWYRGALAGGAEMIKQKTFW